jgi:amidohydrolase
MTMSGIRPAVTALEAATVAMRRDLHEHAELSTNEHRTNEVILERLRVLGLDDVRVVADTGATAIVRGAKPGPHLMWRADTDGLPLQEDTGLAFASKNGAMHACGHDGHVATGLALAELVQASRASLAGTVRFAFQPAEEHVGGARRMIDEGVMTDPRVDRVFGLHIWASNPTGEVLIAPGPIFAAATHLRIIIRGRGGHASAPHQTIDPIVVAAHTIVALQTVVSRSVDPAETAVLTIGRIEGGVRGNIIPNEVMLSGTIRTFEARVLERILRRVDELLAGITTGFGATYQFDHSTLPAVVNDAECAALVEAAAAGLVGADHVGQARATGADDMAYFLQEAPGAYLLLGAAPTDRERVYPHHHPKFDFDEAALPIGIELGLRILEAASGSTLA